MISEYGSGAEGHHFQLLAPAAI